MINVDTYTKEWIGSFKKNKQYNKLDPALIEKMIMAFTLLENLSKSSFNFIFKGGTSLILLLNNANRFSVDIDISTSETKESLESILERITSSSIF
ncbi:MAG: nucleotidyl transferase AbiEii/AbiGii toxin family protein [Bacteroidota bacterium]